MISSLNSVLKRLGPGLLFAGAAVGVSHLVYATRAGAEYGFALLWVIPLIHLLKYPFFEFGPRYAAAQNESLLEGYKKLHPLYLLIFIGITLFTMFTVQAAVTLVTAQLGIHLFQLPLSPINFTLIILLFCSVLLFVGRYQLLDKLMKSIIIGLSLLTLLSFAMALPEAETPNFMPYLPLEGKDLLFFIAFMGWMPAPLDLAVWNSLWTVEKQKEGKYNKTDASFDFNVGYISTAVLACIFLCMGALIMHNPEVNIKNGASDFAQQISQVYSTALGPQVGFIVAIAAFITMFSTTLTCLDALPRSMAKAQTLLSNNAATEVSTKKENQCYWFWLVLLLVGSIGIIALLLKNLKDFLYLATILSFLTAPFFAWANYQLVNKTLPPEDRPSKQLNILAILGFAFLLIFSLVYLKTLWT